MNDLFLIITKPWGYEKILEKNDRYVVKLLHVDIGHSLSLQYHEKKTETLFLCAGKGWIKVFKEDRPHTYYMETLLQKVHIPRGYIHRIGSSSAEFMELLEVSTTELDDVVRIEDDYGRVQPILEYGSEMPVQAFKS